MRMGSKSFAHEAMRAPRWCIIVRFGSNNSANELHKCALSVFTLCSWGEGAKPIAKSIIGIQCLFFPSCETIKPAQQCVFCERWLRVFSVSPTLHRSIHALNAHTHPRRSQIDSHLKYNEKLHRGTELAAARTATGRLHTRMGYLFGRTNAEEV